MQTIDASSLLNPYGLTPTEITSSVSTDKVFRRQCEPNEQVLISRLVCKINRRNREQERLFLVTNEAIYNISGKTIKRKIPLGKLYGVTISRQSQEFVLHVPEEYDYRLKSQEHRDLLLHYITVALRISKNKGLKCYFVMQENLEQFTLQEKTTNPDKQLAHIPKFDPFTLVTTNFQLEFVNRTYSGPQTQVIFIRNKMTMRVKLEDFSKQVIVGVGSLCKTFFVTNKQHQLLVMKSIQQQDVDMDLLELYLNNYLVHPFIETLEIVFLHQQKLIFFFQLKRGGDLYSHIRQSGPFTEVAAKHIVAQLACALQQLHESGIVYGDLKPENVLFDDSGYVSLTDFGYGKMRMFRHFKKQVHTHNNMCQSVLVFTPEYCPPEYLRSLELTRMADWYQLGILLYEMLVGIPPFYHPTIPEITIELALLGQFHLPRNVSVSIPCVEFMAKLLIGDSGLRLGFQSDYKEVSTHPWLQDVDFIGLKEKKIDLPYKPKVGDQQLNESFFCLEQITEEDKQW